MSYCQLASPSALEHVQTAISLVFALRDNSLELPRHSVLTVFASTLLLGRFFNKLSNIKALQYASKQPTQSTGDRIAGIPFPNLIRHFRDMARDIDMSAIMSPAQCYLIEMEQMRILATAIFAAGETVYEARALLDAFSSEKMLTYCASLLRDARADLVYTVPPEERFFAMDLDHWGEVVLPRCGLLINGACKNGYNSLAKECVDSNFLFLLETWSIEALEPQLGASCMFQSLLSHSRDGMSEICDPQA